MTQLETLPSAAQQPQLPRRQAQETCRAVLQDLKLLMALYRRDPERSDADLGHLSTYGLGFDYVPPYTYHDQPEAYFRYQIAWGGPAYEFRFYVNPDFSLHRVEFVYLDWSFSWQRRLRGRWYRLLQEWWQLALEAGQVQQAYLEGQEGRDDAPESQGSVF